MVKRRVAAALVVLWLTVLGSAAIAAAAAPEVLFDLKTDKRIEDIYLIGENEDKKAKDTSIFLDGSGTRIFIVEKNKSISCYRLQASPSGPGRRFAVPGPDGEGPDKATCQRAAFPPGVRPSVLAIRCR